ncbi:MAG: hypothetical protein F6K48_35875 [Okeania sp. SIO3H1]|nr:hypothetical protein [Okeania sp. SIO3H1]
MFYLAMAGIYTPEYIAKKTGQSYKNIHSDFNKNIGKDLKEHFKFHLKEHFESQSKKLRFGVTSIRTTLFSLDQKYLVQNNDNDLINILSNRLKENSEVEKDAKVEENIQDDSDCAH